MPYRSRHIQRPATVGIGNPISPSRLAVYSYVIFLAALVFPPGIYTSLIREPDLMFLDPVLFLFFTACFLAFVVGVKLTKFFSTEAPQQEAAVRELSLTALCLPILFCSAICVAYILTLGSHIDFLAILRSQQGNLIKLANASSQLQAGQLDKAVPLLTAALWWAYARAQRQTLSNRQKRVFFLVFGIGILAATLVCVATVDRTRLMPMVIGTGILAVHERYRRGQLSPARLLSLSLIGAVLFLTIFLGFSFLRGAGNLNLLAYSLLGYTFVSYNRTAALLSKVLYPTYQGKGIYLFFYLTETEQLENIFHFRSAFNWPNFNALFNSEFDAVNGSGLNQAFNWFGTFGYLYTDLGWYAPFYMLFLGVIIGLLWRGFQKGTLFCSILYPYFGFSILFWIGWNVAFSQDAFFLVEAFIVLFLYEKVFSTSPQLPSTPEVKRRRFRSRAPHITDEGVRVW